MTAERVLLLGVVNTIVDIQVRKKYDKILCLLGHYQLLKHDYTGVGYVRDAHVKLLLFFENYFILLISK